MDNKKKQLIHALVVVGESMKLFAEQAAYEEFNKLIDPDFYQRMNATIEREKNYNGWFTPDAVRGAMGNVATWLTKEQLEEWLEDQLFAKSPKQVGVIMAGNIPFVGFHDFLAIILSGHKVILKPSSDDQRLWPLLIELIQFFYPDIVNHVSISPQLKHIEAVIATGSDNSARYFEKYFGHLPHIIRKNRTSIAVLNGEESEGELKLLGEDVFTYFGLGCRNVSQLLVKDTFDLDRFFGAIVDHAPIVNHHKYGNNYDYYKAIYLMNREVITENGFLLTKSSDELFAPTAVLFIKRYTEFSEVNDYISQNKDKIQVVVGKEFTPFGKAQRPELTDYADGINTLDFLKQL